MQSSPDIGVDRTSLNPSTPRKRKLQDRFNAHSPAVPSQPVHDPSASFAAKKHKIATNVTSLVGTMSRSMAVGSQPRPIDLTTLGTAFEPHRGAKKLVIKNLKISSPDVEKYYTDTWQELDLAVRLILNGEKTQTPLEKLCRGVEMTCRKGRAQNLYEHFKAQCRSHVENQLLPAILSKVGTSSVEALRAVHEYWIVWHKRTTLLRSIFSYLDRSYLLNSKDLPQLEDLSIQQFRNAIFGKSRTTLRPKLGTEVVAGMCELVQQDRGGNDTFDGVLLKDSIAMLHILGTYDQYFEPKLLEQAADYYSDFVRERGTSSLKSYISWCDGLLNREGLRCDRYNINSSTKARLLAMAYRILIESSSEILLSVDGVSKLIDNDDLASLKTLYYLLSLSKITPKLRSPFEQHIKKVGGGIIRDQEKVEEMVVRLLVFKRSLDVIIRDAFQKDDTFSYCLRDAFGNFMNDRKNTSAWGTNNSKVGEMIAKYMDLLLRGGVKAVPRELVSDDKDRATAEKEGQASTGDEDAELDRQLEQGLELFRFIEGKDVFEAFYKKDLARRLLMARSASQDAERSMLAKLKIECGTTFTHNLEQMFKDQDISRDEMITYKQHLSNTSKTSMDLQVSVLSAAAWPTYPDVPVKLPVEVARHLEKYDRHYKNKHNGRKLNWKHSLAHSVVRAQFNKGVKELLVSSFQAIVLVLFNDLPDNAPLSYTTIRETTTLPDVELIRTLQSLACARLRVLTKHPKGREVNPTDTFTVNLAFTDAKFRVKINQIQLKETKEENAETHERVYQDRQYETQAAIVRIMKSRKTMAHQQLVAEVIEQTKKRGAVELGEIKKNIEKLLEKEYIEREGGNYVYVS